MATKFPSPNRSRRSNKSSDGSGGDRLGSLFSGGDNNGGEQKKSRSRTKRGEELRHSSHTQATYGTTKERIYDSVPPSYLHNPKSADPILFYLPRLLENSLEAKDNPTLSGGKKKAAQLSLRNLTKAAEEDVRLHRARVQAGLGRDIRLLRTYQLEADPQYKQRQERLAERADLINELDSQSEVILEEMQNKSDSHGLTQSERAQVHLARWQRAARGGRTLCGRG